MKETNKTMKYHKVFKHFDRRAVAETRELMRGFGSMPDALKVMKLETWLREVSDIYGVVTPSLTISSTVGAGCYYPRDNAIFIPKPSIVTTLHEFRHAMQRQGRALSFYDASKGAEHRSGGYEVDARAWSLSLYYAVAPRTFARLVGTGEILHITTDDLTRV